MASQIEIQLSVDEITGYIIQGISKQEILQKVAEKSEMSVRTFEDRYAQAQAKLQEGLKKSGGLEKAIAMLHDALPKAIDTLTKAMDSHGEDMKPSANAIRAASKVVETGIPKEIHNKNEDAGTSKLYDVLSEYLNRK